jgi:hypothetical protein
LFTQEHLSLENRIMVLLIGWLGSAKKREFRHACA